MTDAISHDLGLQFRASLGCVISGLGASSNDNGQVGLGAWCCLTRVFCKGNG